MLLLVFNPLTEEEEGGSMAINPAVLTIITYFVEFWSISTVS
jgi:hypothetical protein